MLFWSVGLRRPITCRSMYLIEVATKSMAQIVQRTRSGRPLWEMPASRPCSLSVWTRFIRVTCPSKLVRTTHELVRQIARHYKSFVFVEPVLGDKLCEISAVSPPRSVVATRDREKCPGVVVKADGVVEPGRFGHVCAESHHAFWTVVEPPRRPQLQTWV